MKEAELKAKEAVLLQKETNARIESRIARIESRNVDLIKKMFNDQIKVETDPIVRQRLVKRRDWKINEVRLRGAAAGAVRVSDV